MNDDKTMNQDKPKLTIEVAGEEAREAQVTSTLEAPVEEAPADMEKEQAHRASLEEIIREQATEEDTPLTAANFSLRKIIGGDILMAEIVRRQVWLFILITGFLIVYIAERYSCEKYMNEIDALQVELEDVKKKALASTSELSERTRQSKVLDMLQANRDSLLKIASQPPYIIQVPEGE